MALDTAILAQLRSRRRTMLEIFLIATFLGLLLNIFSNILYDHFSNKNGWLDLKLLIWIGIFTACNLFILFIFIREREPFESRFRIVLPFSGSDDTLTIHAIPGYAPSEKANVVLKAALKHNPGEETAIITQLGLPGGAPGPGTGYGFACVEKIIVTLFVNMLQRHCEHTQTRLGRYHLKYADYCQRLETTTFNVDSDAIFGHSLPFLPQYVKLPRHMSLSLLGVEKRPNLLQLTSPYASLKIYILPQWSIITQKKSLKTFLSATRNLVEPVVLLSIPIKVVAKVGYRALWNRKEGDDYCDWVELFLDEIRQWFAWEHFAEGETERLLVELLMTVRKGGCDTGQDEVR